jgi:hypothetical protein
VSRKKIVGSITLFLIIALTSVAVGHPLLYSSEVAGVKAPIQKIGDTDITLGFDKQIELFTNKEKFFRIKVENTGENDLMYYTSLDLIGPEGINVTSWGKSSFSISPGNDYEFVFLLEGLEPGSYELKLSVEEDFYASITLIEDLFRLGILGFIPSLEGLMPDMLGMSPFLVEMFLYLGISDMWTPFIDRFLTLLADSPTIATSITYSIMRELDDILLPTSKLLSGVAKDLPSILGAWIRSLPETVDYLGESLIDAPSYSLTHLSDFFTEGYLPMIEKLPKTLDGLLELLADCRFWGPNTAAIALDNLREIWAMENVSLATHITSDAVCLGIAGLYLFALTPAGLLATPLYESYHNDVYPVLERLVSSLYEVASPVIVRMNKALSRVTVPLGGSYKVLARGVLPPLFSFVVVPLVDAISSPLADPLEEILKGAWAGLSQMNVGPGKLSEVSNEMLAPRFASLSEWLWEKGAESKPVPLSAERGEATFSIEVEVKDMGVVESVGVRLKDIWDTTIGTIHGLATGEY